MVIQFCGSVDNFSKAMAVVRCTSGSSLVIYDTIGVTVRKRPNSCVLLPNVAQLAIAAAKFFLNESSVVLTKKITQ